MRARGSAASVIVRAFVLLAMCIAVLVWTVDVLMGSLAAAT